MTPAPPGRFGAIPVTGAGTWLAWQILEAARIRRLELIKLSGGMAHQSRKGNLLWWIIPGVLAGMPMPFIHPERRLNLGGALNAYEDELPDLHSAGVRAVVSLLNIPSDAAVFESAGFAFLCLPVPDGYPPTPEQATEFVHFVEQERTKNLPVAVHCEAGLGRTGTMLAVYLIARGDTAGMAIRRIRSVEKVAVETSRQIEFLEMFARTHQPPNNTKRT